MTILSLAHTSSPFARSTANRCSVKSLAISCDPIALGALSRRAGRICRAITRMWCWMNSSSCRPTPIRSSCWLAIQNRLRPLLNTFPRASCPSHQRGTGCLKSCAPSSRFLPNALTRCAVQQVLLCGNATTTSTSSAMIVLYRRSANTFVTTRYVGIWIGTIPLPLAQTQRPLRYGECWMNCRFSHACQIATGSSCGKREGSKSTPWEKTAQAQVRILCAAATKARRLALPRLTKRR